MPSYWLFGISLTIIGISAQTLMTTANGTVQMATDPALRGRVMAIYMAIFMGGTPIGAPIVGWVADTFGPRWALGVGAASGIAAALVGVFYLVKYRNLRVEFSSWRVHVTFDDRADASEAIAAEEVAVLKA
jgi:MFS family permease